MNLNENTYVEMVTGYDTLFPPENELFQEENNFTRGLLKNW